jgi:hypothetical protein
LPVRWDAWLTRSFTFAQRVLDFSFCWFDGALGLSFAVASHFTGLALGATGDAFTFLSTRSSSLIFCDRM